MNLKLAVLAAALFLGPTCRAQTVSSANYPAAVAAEKKDAASGIIRGVGRRHEAADLREAGAAAAVRDRGAWPQDGLVMSLNPKGEAILDYVETSARVKRLAAEAVRQDRLYKQCQDLAALAGPSESVELSLRSMEKRLVDAVIDRHEAQVHQAAVRELLLEAKWASALPDGGLALDPGWGVDVAVTHLRPIL